VIEKGEIEKPENSMDWKQKAYRLREYEKDMSQLPEVQIQPRTHWRPSSCNRPLWSTTPSQGRMDIPNNFSQPDGWDIISRGDKLRREICNDDDASFGNSWHDLTI
jgi:hypothetical protein